MSALIPVIEITDDDPRWHELRKMKHEARLRWAQCDEARREAEAVTDPKRERPDWSVAPVFKKPRIKVVVWD